MYVVSSQSTPWGRLEGFTGFTSWLPNWIDRGFRTTQGEPVKNQALIRYLSAHLDARAKCGQQVKLEYVKGHAGIEGNEGADAQANLGATMPRIAERNWAQLQGELEKEMTDLKHAMDHPISNPQIEVHD